MDYNLCKELKETGFPQEDKDWYFSTYGLECKKKPCLMPVEDNNPSFMEDYTAIPTLSELIEALGDEFDSLNRSESWQIHRWHCNQFDYPDGSIGYADNSEGDTPQEALARLYISIHTPIVTDNKDMID